MKKAILLFLCLLLTTLMISGCNTTDIVGNTESDYSPLENNSEQVTEQDKRYRVTFYLNDVNNDNEPNNQNSGNSDNSQEQIAKVDAVDKHESATPPIPETPPGKVFVKWDTDFSDIKQDTEVHAVMEDVSDKPNVIAAEGAYGVQGQAVTVPIKLCGIVKLAGVDITISYDADALLFDSVFNADDAVIYNADIPGEIHINFVSAGNTTADVDLCSLKFNIEAMEGEHSVETRINSIYAYKGSADLYTPEYTVIDAKVYVYE